MAATQEARHGAESRLARLSFVRTGLTGLHHFGSLPAYVRGEGIATLGRSWEARQSASSLVGGVWREPRRSPVKRRPKRAGGLLDVPWGRCRVHSDPFFLLALPAPFLSCPSFDRST